MNRPIPFDEDIRAHFSQRKIQPDEVLWSKVLGQINSDKKHLKMPGKSVLRIAAMWFFTTGMATLLTLYLVSYKNQKTDIKIVQTEIKSENNLPQFENSEFISNNISPQSGNSVEKGVQNIITKENIIKFKTTKGSGTSEKLISLNEDSNKILNNEFLSDKINTSYIVENIQININSEPIISEQNIPKQSELKVSRYDHLKRPRIDPSSLLIAVDTEYQPGILNKAFKSLQANAENILVYVGDRNKHGE